MEKESKVFGEAFGNGVIVAQGYPSIALGYATKEGIIQANDGELVIGIADGTEDSFEIRHKITESQFNTLSNMVVKMEGYKSNIKCEEIKFIHNWKDTTLNIVYATNPYSYPPKQRECVNCGKQEVLTMKQKEIQEWEDY